MPTWRAWLCTALISGAICLGTVSLSSATEPANDVWPRRYLGTGADGIAFTPNEVCGDCHAAQLAEWSTSHHFRAMARATEKSVLGDFNDASFTDAGKTTRFFRRDGRFFVNTEGPGGIAKDFEVGYTFGVAPLQQYLISLPGGRLQALTVAWDTKAKRWFSLFPGEKIEPGEPLHWTGRGHNWNTRCAECHSTNLRKNYDAKTETFRTEWAEINVSCQSCHGPGAAHVKWAKDGALAGANKGLVVDYANLGSKGQIETCARCHSRRHRITADDKHGRPFLDDFVPARLHDGLYHADGQILDEVYVYGSFLQSKMYAAGVKCTDCHNPHSGRLVAKDNSLCTRCHQPRKQERFPALKAALYDSPDHHHHKPGAPGAACVDCHMRSRTYMVVDPRRDHRFRVPRPDLSAKIGTPNACIGCHDDKSNNWATARIGKWFTPNSLGQPHYGEAIAAGRSGDPGAVRGLAALSEDSKTSPIVRATAIDLLSRYGAASAEALVKGLSDKDPLVRASAVRGLSFAPARARLQLAPQLLTDPARAVRIEAARLLAPIPVARMDGKLRKPFRSALDEYIEAQNASAETPEAHMNLARLYADMRRPEKAEAEYKIAMRLAPEFLPARLGLASFYNGVRRNKEAEAVLRATIERAPDFGQAHYSLGLLLAEMQRPRDAVTALRNATFLMPNRPRVHYNYGLALQRAGRMKAAELALLRSYRLRPQTPGTIQALAILFAQQANWTEAERYAGQLVRLYPNAPGPRRLLQGIRRRGR